MRLLGYRAQGTITVRETLLKKVNMEALLLFLNDQDLSSEDRDYIGKNNVTKVSWTEKDNMKWGGSAPEVSVEYDPLTGFMHSFTVIYSRRKAKVPFSANELKDKFKKELAKVGIWLPGDEIMDGFDLGDDEPATAPGKK